MPGVETHWEGVYSSKSASDVSWFQEHAEVSLRLIKNTGVGPSAAIIDVGGGASVLVDDLLAGGYSRLTVLDISPSALAVSVERLGARANGVTWIEANLLTVELPRHAFDLWHDRAVFHFLTEANDRERYLQKVRDSVKPGGHVIVATFGPDGPLRCSGLPVKRYSPETLLEEFGSDFKMLEHSLQVHRTPFGTEQQFLFCRCRVA